MTATAINYSNLFSQSWQNIYDLINVKASVVDPTTSSTEYRKWIYSREPDAKSIEFKGFPVIIIHPSTFNTTEGGSVSGIKKFMEWTMEIEVITSDRGYNNVDGKGLSHMDAICDDIIETLFKSANQSTLNTNSIHFININSSRVVVEDFNNTLIYRRSIIVGFKSRLAVSA